MVGESGWILHSSAQVVAGKRGTVQGKNSKTGLDPKSNDNDIGLSLNVRHGSSQVLCGQIRYRDLQWN